MSKSNLKVIIPLLIAVVIGGIWFAKNANIPENKPPATQTSNTPDPTQNNTPSSEVTNETSADPDTDFALHATSIDLKTLKSYGLPILIQFGADDCAPCKAMAPILEKLNAELQGKAIVKFVDVWKYRNAAKDFPLELIPTQFFFDKDGNPYAPSDPEKMQMRMYTMKDTNEHVYTAHQGGMTEEQIREVFKEMGAK